VRAALNCYNVDQELKLEADRGWQLFLRVVIWSGGWRKFRYCLPSAGVFSSLEALLENKKGEWRCAGWEVIWNTRTFLLHPLYVSWFFVPQSHSTSIFFHLFCHYARCDAVRAKTFCITEFFPPSRKEFWVRIVSTRAGDENERV
jgi:hypothetical protein